MTVALDPELFPEDPEFVLLDIGPGHGGAAEVYGEHRRIVTVEVDEELARSVTRRRAAIPLLSCCGSGDNLPLRDGAVDGVIALEVLEHVPDPDAVLAEAFRVLRPGGALCVAVPTSYTEAVYSRLNSEYMSNATHVRIFKKPDLHAHIERHGFVLGRTTTEHLEPALAWLGHALLKSRSDAAGVVHDNHWVNARLAQVMERVSRTKGVWRVVPWARERFGKSWYVYATKPEEA